MHQKEKTIELLELVLVAVAHSALAPVPSWHRESPAELLSSSSSRASCLRPHCHFPGDICLPALALLQHIPGHFPLWAAPVPAAMGCGMALNPWAQLILVPPRAATWHQGWPPRWRRWQLPGLAAVTALWQQRVGNKTHPGTLLAAGSPGAEKGLCSFKNIS